MKPTESDTRCYANIINAPDPLAGIELVAAHREAGLLAGAKAMQEKAAELVEDHEDVEFEFAARIIRQLDPAQIARDTSLSPECE